MTRSQWVVLGAVLMALGAGCADRTHMTRSWGRAYGEAFARQQVNPEAGGQQPPSGLDSQEASIVAHSYRRSLAPKGATAPAQEQSTLWVAPGSQHGGGAYMPPPSVPSTMAR